VGRLVVGQTLAGLGTLHVVEPELAAHLHAVFAGDGATFVSALDDAQALVLGHGGDEGHEAAADGACQINVGAGAHAGGGLSVDESLQDLQAVPHGAGGPVPFGDHELVAGSEAVEGLPELRPAGEALARRGVLEDRVAALGLERADLALELLGLGADAGITDPARRCSGSRAWRRLLQTPSADDVASAHDLVPRTGFRPQVLCASFMRLISPGASNGQALRHRTLPGAPLTLPS